MRTTLFLCLICMFMYSCSESVTSSGHSFAPDDKFKKKNESNKSNNTKKLKVGRFDPEINEGFIQFDLLDDIKIDFLRKSRKSDQLKIKRDFFEIEFNGPINQMVYDQSVKGKLNVDSIKVKDLFGSNFFKFNKEGALLWESTKNLIRKDKIEKIDFKMKTNFKVDEQSFAQKISSLKIGLFLLTPDYELKLLDVVDPVHEKFLGEMISVNELNTYFSNLSLNFHLNLIEKNIPINSRGEGGLALKVVDMKYQTKEGSLSSFKDEFYQSFQDKNLLYLYDGASFEIFSHNTEDLISVLKNIDPSVSYKELNGRIKVRRFLGKRGSFEMENNWFLRFDPESGVHYLLFLSNRKKVRSIIESKTITRKLGKNLREEVYLEKGDIVYLDFDAHARRYQSSWNSRFVQLIDGYQNANPPSLGVGGSIFSISETAIKGLPILKECRIHERALSVINEENKKNITDFFMSSIKLFLNSKEVEPSGGVVTPFKEGFLMKFEAPESGAFEVVISDWGQHIHTSLEKPWKFSNCEVDTSDIQSLNDLKDLVNGRYRHPQEERPELVPKGHLFITLHSLL